jgi:hypothetical protein
MKNVGSIIVGLLLMFGMSGCSSFHKEWKAAIKAPIPSGSIDGPWAGEWRSDVNGHYGSLRCVVTQTSDTTYRAHFRAHFWKIFRFTYVAALNGRQTNSGVKFEGEAKLPKWAGGVYRYDGISTATDFRSSYASKDDHGNYQLRRPAPK